MLASGLAREPQRLKLYSDRDDEEAPQHPKWYEHPRFGHKVDVVALKMDLPDEEKPIFRVMAVNRIPDLPDLRLSVASDAFVLGYPLGIGASAGRDVPIWKRATVASEPQLPADLPYIFVDTATRKGMSGAPVVIWHHGGLTYPKEGGGLGGPKFGGRFIGIYASRLGGDEFQAQLGKVWRREAIEEIIDAGVSGETSF